MVGHLRSVRGERAAASRGTRCALPVPRSVRVLACADDVDASDLVQQPKSDTLIFLPLSFVNRFKDREGQEIALDRFFGTTGWRSVPDGPDRPARLLALFETQLKKAGLELRRSIQTQVPTARTSTSSSAVQGIRKAGRASRRRSGPSTRSTARSIDAPKPPPPGQQTLGFAGARATGANTEPLLDAPVRAEFGGAGSRVEEAMLLTEQSRFLDTHLKRATLAPAEARGELLVERPQGARQFKEGKGITMDSDRVRRRSEHMFV